jgi:hypothetical protein
MRALTTSEGYVTIHEKQAAMEEEAKKHSAA